MHMKIGFDISCTLSSNETISMKCQSLFSKKCKTNACISKLLSAKFAHRSRLNFYHVLCSGFEFKKQKKKKKKKKKQVPYLYFLGAIINNSIKDIGFSPKYGI